MSTETTEEEEFNGWESFSLPAQLTLEHATELQQQLIGLIGKRVQLYGDDVQRIDTAALQVLVAFFLHPETTAGWINSSATLQRSAQLLGLSHLLQLPATSDDIEVL